MSKIPSIRSAISSSFDKYFGSIKGGSKELLLLNLISPLLLGCNNTGAIVIVFSYKLGPKYSLYTYKNELIFNYINRYIKFILGLFIMYFFRNSHSFF